MAVGQQGPLYYDACRLIRSDDAFKPEDRLLALSLVCRITSGRHDSWTPDERQDLRRNAIVGPFTK